MESIQRACFIVFLESFFALSPIHYARLPFTSLESFFDQFLSCIFQVREHSEIAEGLPYKEVISMSTNG